PAPTGVKIEGNTITWNAGADLESGIAQFIIKRDGKEIGTVPEKDSHKRGRPIFQGLQYSDTPEFPLAKMEFADESAEAGKHYQYRVISVNTVGLKSRKPASTP
ncbi:MAG: hypothetical protein HKN23_18230, partial [Verrucomicrobiales bacterium]|nr:hypothetical protein [Verrucomicrobiales bacterium]